MAHTLGPLRVVPAEGVDFEETKEPVYYDVKDAQGERDYLGLASVFPKPDHGYPREEAEANARLFAAAPDFYEAATGDEEPMLWSVNFVEILCQWARDTLRKLPEDDDPQAVVSGISEVETMCKRLRAAIAKARGLN